jgi:hypothetical protein
MGGSLGLAGRCTHAPLGRAAAMADDHKSGLSGWGIGPVALADYVARRHVRVITPGSSAGELLHVLSSLERRSERWDSDTGSARAALSAAVSLLLRLLGREPDPAKSRDHAALRARRAPTGARAVR